MKKTYVKPRLFAESFALTEHISSGCAYPTGHTTCAITEPDSGFTFFTSSSDCAEGIEMFWATAGVTGTPSYADLPSLNSDPDNQLCYNSFLNSEILVTS